MIPDPNNLEKRLFYKAHKCIIIIQTIVCSLCTYIFDIDVREDQMNERELVILLQREEKWL